MKKNLLIRKNHSTRGEKQVQAKPVYYFVKLHLQWNLFYFYSISYPKQIFNLFF
jgi:hypothetical protein